MKTRRVRQKIAKVDPKALPRSLSLSFEIASKYLALIRLQELAVPYVRLASFENSCNLQSFELSKTKTGAMKQNFEFLKHLHTTHH